MSEARKAQDDMSLRRFRPYPEYKDSGVEWLGEIPEHWDVAPVYARYEVALGKMLDAKRVTGQSSGRYLRNVDVQWDAVNTEGIPEMDFAPWERDRYLLRPGDLLVCEGGEVGRTAVWRGDIQECFYQKAIHRVRPRSEKEVPRFFYHLIYTLAKRGVFVAGGNPNTIDHLTAVQLRHYRLPFAPSQEQRAIAAFLDRKTARIDALVAKKERLIELLQEKRTALITRAVTRGLDPNVPMKDSGVEWLGEIPAHWEVKKWRYCCHVTEGQVAPDDHRYRDRIMIAPNHIESGTGRILFTETSDEQGAISGKYLVKPGDLIYSKIRPALNKACIATGDWLCSADMYPVEVTARDLRAQYLLYFILSEAFVRLMVDESMRVAMPKVNREKLAACPLLIPPPSEQDAIVAHLDRETARIDALVAKVRSAIARLKELRTALISAAVTGKIDVRAEVHSEVGEAQAG